MPSAKSNKVGDLVAVYLGQHQVEHRQVGQLTRQGGEGRFTVAHGGHPVAGALQVERDHLADTRLVFHYEDRRFVQISLRFYSAVLA